MKKDLLKVYSVLSMAAMLLLTGCATERPSDLTMDELEIKMAQAMDPDGSYRRANSYFQRQNVEEKGFWSTDRQMVEVKFQRPDKFKFSYYEKNKIASEILSKDNRAWMIDYQKGTVTELAGDAMEKIKLMLALGHPDTDYDKIFDKVALSLVELEDGREYYKMVCQPRIQDSHPIIIYVDKLESLPKRMILKVKTPNGTVNSTSNIEKYDFFNNLKLPVLTRVEDGSREYTTRVVGYQLDAKFNADAFELPKFDPVLMEVEKQKKR